MNIEEFKNFVKKENPFKLDNIDMEHGRMTIHRCNINKYLEQYACKNEDDLFDTLYMSFGIWIKIID